MTTTSTATYTLHIGTNLDGQGGTIVEALVTKDIPAGICGPFTGTATLTGGIEGTPAGLVAHALEVLRLDREFTAAEPQVRVGWNGLNLTCTLTHI